MALTPKQARFVEEYLTDLNATQAAVRAGYSAKTANREGSRLLSNVDIRAAIDAGRRAKAARAELSQDWVLRKLRREATRLGDGASHSARVAAIKLLGQHLGMFGEKTPLEQMLASLPPELAAGLRQELARLLQSGGVAPGGGTGPASSPPG